MWGGENDADQVTTYSYGAGGLPAPETNALGVTSRFAYDTGSNLTQERYLRADADGRLSRRYDHDRVRSGQPRGFAHHAYD